LWPGGVSNNGGVLRDGSLLKPRGPLLPNGTGQPSILLWRTDTTGKGITAATAVITFAAAAAVASAAITTIACTTTAEPRTACTADAFGLLR